MATIKLKNGSGAPLASDLVQGEPALDLTNKRLYTEDSGGAVIEVGVNPTELNVTNNITVGGTVDGRDIATDGTKLDGIEAGADVTDTANVTAAGALMDSELTSEASVKALNQGVATTDSPTFAGLGTTGDVTFGDNDKAIFGAGSDLQIYHDGSHSYIDDAGTGLLRLRSNTIYLEKYTGELLADFNADGYVSLLHDNSEKFRTTSTGIDVTGKVEADTAHINSSSSGQTANGLADDLVVETSGDTGISILSGATSDGRIFFGDSGSQYAGFIKYDHTANEFGFGTNGGASEKVTIDSSGNLDVTGTVTADGLTVANSTAPIITLDETGVGTFYHVVDGNAFSIRNNSLSNTSFKITSGGDISFANSAGTSQDLFWDASTSRLGLGTTSPSYQLDVQGSSAAIYVDNTAGSPDQTLMVFQADMGTNDRNFQIKSPSTDSASEPFRFVTGNSFAFEIDTTTDAFVIDSNANVGIGETSPSDELHIRTGDYSTNQDGGISFRTGATGSSGTRYRIGQKVDSGGSSRFFIDVPSDASGNTTEALCVKSSGNVGIGTSSPSSFNQVGADSLVVGSGSGEQGITIYSGTANNGVLAFADGTTTTQQYQGYIGYNHASNYMRFFTGASERMRIDSSGNLLVGKTVSSLGTEGVTLGPNGQHYFTSDAEAAVKLNRLTSDGEIVQFRKDGTIVGSIGSISSEFYIAHDNTTDSGLRFRNGIIQPCNASGGSNDDAVSLGQTSMRFKDIYATNGTIQTSDRNEKQDIGLLSEAEQRVAVAAKGLLRKFRWKSAVEEKGDDARIHFGIIAQDLQDAFTAEGLDAGRYGMFINSTWTDEETGEERSRMGVRYSELLAFIISAI